MKLLGDRIVVKLNTEPRERRSGLVVPAPSMEENNYGTIVNVGTQVKEYRVGDKVYFNKASGKIYNFDGQVRVMLYTTDIILKHSS